MSAPTGNDAVPAVVGEQDIEIVDGEPVLEARAGRTAAGSLDIPGLIARAEVPGAVVQAAAAAAGGFVAGAALLGLVQHRQRRSAALARSSRPRLVRRAQAAAGNVGELVQIVGTRSLLVDVHLLAGPSSQGER